MMWDWYGPSGFFLFCSISTVLEFFSYLPVGSFLGCTKSTWSPESDCGRDSSFPGGSGLQYCISYTKIYNANPHLVCKQLLRSTTLNFNAVKWKSLSPVQLFAITWTVAQQVPLSMEFSRLKYWSGLPWPPSGDLSYPVIEPKSLMSPALAGRFFTTVPLGKPHIYNS